MAFSRAATFCSTVAEGAAEVEAGAVVRVVFLVEAVVDTVVKAVNIRDEAAEVLEEPEAVEETSGADVEEGEAQEEEKADAGTVSPPAEEAPELGTLTERQEESRVTKQSPTLNQNAFIRTPHFK